MGHNYSHTAIYSFDWSVTDTEFEIIIWNFIFAHQMVIVCFGQTIGIWAFGFCENSQNHIDFLVCTWYPQKMIRSLKGERKHIIMPTCINHIHRFHSLIKLMLNCATAHISVRTLLLLQYLRLCMLELWPPKLNTFEAQAKP